MKHKLFMLFNEDRLISVRKTEGNIGQSQYGFWLTINIPDSIFAQPMPDNILIEVPENAIVNPQRVTAEVERPNAEDAPQQAEKGRE